MTRRRWCRLPRWPERTYHTTSGKRPLLRAVRVNGIKIIIIRPDIDGAIRPDGRGRCSSTSDIQRPLFGTIRVDGIETHHIDQLPEKDGAVRPDDRGAANAIPGEERPLLHRRGRADKCTAPGVLRVVLEHPPVAAPAVGGGGRETESAQEGEQAQQGQPGAAGEEQRFTDYHHKIPLSAYRGMAAMGEAKAMPVHRSLLATSEALLRQLV